MSRDPEQDWFPWDEPTGAYPRVDPDATMMLPQIVGESLPGAEAELAVERTVQFRPVPGPNDATTVLRPIDGRPTETRPIGNRPADDATTVLPTIRDAGGDPTVRLRTPEQPAPTQPVPAQADGDRPRENTAAGNSAIMAIGSLVSRGTGFLRTAMIAAALGGVALGLGDAYTTAQFFPGMVYEFLIGGVLSSVIIPVLVRARRNDADGGEAYAQRLMTLTALVLGVAAILATLAAPLLTMIYTKSATGSDYRNLVTALSYFTLPAIFFFGVSAVLSAYLNTRGVFGPPMWTPILNNIVVIATCLLYIVFFGSVARKAGDVSPAMVALLGGGTLLGITLQTAGLLPALRRAGFRWKARFDFRALGLRELAHLGGWMFCYVAVSQVGVLVMLRLLSGDSLLIYNNVYLLMMMAHGIVAVSIITALMPRMSAASAAGRIADLVDDLAKGVRTTSAMLAPIVVAFVFLAGPTLVSLFAHGAFTDHDASRGAPVLIMAGVSLIPFSLSQLFTFCFYALPDTKTPALLNIPVVLARIIAQWVLFAIGLQAAGVMLGNGISYVLATALSIWQLHKRIGSLGLGRTAWTLARIAGAMAAAGVLGWLTVLVLRKIGIDSSWLQLILGGGVIMASYLAVAKGLRIEEIDDVFSLIGRVRRKVLRR